MRNRFRVIAGFSLLALFIWASMFAADYLWPHEGVLGHALHTLVAVAVPVVVYGALAIRVWRRRDEVEAALRESEARYRTLANSSPVGIYIVQDRKCQFVNPQFQEYTGFAEDELVGVDSLQLLHPEDREKVRANAVQMLKGNRLAPYEFRFIRKSGEPRWAMETVTSIQYQGRRATLGNFMDITERKQTEEALRASRRRFRDLVELLPQTVWETDEKLTFTFVNREGFRTHGYAPEEITEPMNAVEVFIPDDRDSVRENAGRVLSGEGPGGVEYTALRKDGSTFPVVLYAAPIVEGDKTVGLRGVTIDITERKQAEEREKQLQRELSLSSRLASIGELAAGVAHEINNPLTGIVGFSQLLMGRSTDVETRRDLERIHGEALRAAQVVRNLVAFARRGEPEKKPADINDILQKALELMVYTLEKSDIAVDAELAPDLPKVTADRQQVQQVFLNIIVNAEQAMAEANGGGKLVVKTELMNDHVRITFADDGPGIPAEYLDKLFDPFFTTRGEKGGTGLGLSACHGIVAEHGGRIYVESEPGKGTTFFVELPLAADEIDESRVAEKETIGRGDGS